MANYGNNQNFWDGQAPNQNQDFNFEMPDQFGQELWDYMTLIMDGKALTTVICMHRNFQTFDNQAQAPAAQTQDNNLYANAPPGNYGGSFLDPSQTTSSLYGQGDFGQKSYTGNEFDDEPPLLEGKLILVLKHIGM